MAGGKSRPHASKQSAKATRNFQEGLALVQAHPLLSPMLHRASIVRGTGHPYPQQGWANVSPNGSIFVHPERVADPKEWFYVIAHCLVHLGFGHFQKKFQQREWDLACECIVWDFLGTLKLGKPPEHLCGVPQPGGPEIPGRTEDALFRYFCENGIPSDLPPYSLTGTNRTDMLDAESTPKTYGRSSAKKEDWERTFGAGLVQAVSDAVNIAGGVSSAPGKKSRTPARRARDWFVNSYPLLGALAASFELIEDGPVCNRMDISVAAVSDALKEIYISPGVGLSESECRFVIAH